MFLKKRLKIRGVVQDLQQWREGFGGVHKVLQFRLETNDEQMENYPFVSVHMEGNSLRGIVRPGEEVTVKGKLNRKKVLFAKRIEVTATGEVVTA